MAQLDVPAGTYLATVSSRLYSQGADTSGTAVCTLSPNSPMTSVPRGDDQVFAPTWIDAGVSGWHTSSVQQVITLGWPGKVYLACTSAVPNVYVDMGAMTLLKVTDVHPAP